MISLTGCMKKYPLTDTGTNLVAEYMAGVLLSNDKGFAGSALSYQEKDKFADTGYSKGEAEEVEEIVSDDKGTDTVNKSESHESGTEDVSVVSLSDIFGDKDLKIQYVGYKLLDSYPEGKENKVFSVDAKEGFQLIVADFSVENISNKDKTFDLSRSDIKYQLNLNKNGTYKPLTVLMENNLQFINMNVKAGEKISAILIFEIPKEKDISKLTLNISKGSKSGTLVLSR